MHTQFFFKINIYCYFFFEQKEQKIIFKKNIYPEFMIKYLSLCVAGFSAFWKLSKFKNIQNL